MTFKIIYKLLITSFSQEEREFLQCKNIIFFISIHVSIK